MKLLLDVIKYIIIFIQTILQTFEVLRHAITVQTIVHKCLSRLQSNQFEARLLPFHSFPMATPLALYASVATFGPNASPSELCGGSASDGPVEPESLGGGSSGGGSGAARALARCAAASARPRAYASLRRCAAASSEPAGSVYLPPS